MRKPMMTMTEEPKPRNIMRADVTISEGFGIEVDGQMKAVFDTKEDAEKEALELKTKYPMLQIKVYDAAQKTSAVITAKEASPDER
jgi:pyruvate/2-oxoglutarate/acetoin dehydrogenase E1 component